MDEDSSLNKYALMLSNRSMTVAIAESAVSSSLIVAATLGNFLVLWIVYRNRNLRTIPNQFVISLAVSDILMAGICAPPCLSVLVAGRRTFSNFVCQLQGFAIACLACVSLLTMMLVAVNRYFLIVRPQKYQRIFTPTNTKLMIVSVWILSLMEPLPYLLSGHHYEYHPGKVFCFQVLRINFYTLLGYVYVVVPLVILTACYWKVFRVLRQHKVRVRKLRSSCAFDCTSSRQVVSFEDINVTRTLFITVCGFLICWIPISIVDFIGFFQGTWALPRQVYLMYTFLGQLSTTLNPVIYGVMNKTFREEYKKMLCCCKAAESGTPRTSKSDNSQNSHPTKESKCSIV
ncbi:melatonin receptor type 1C-like [Exaiptasia diaphana]|uniref:G-protein coupled receptors family 1 profile domain-containing protein n=1 Tax=Exaiptasia diaphana TaxID=2652724 RepID=A0A913YHF2_EXADI|nr:melatonin receptor type 1C-like [Exaiptasia diaphana]